MTAVILKHGFDFKFNFRENKETKVKRPSLELSLPLIDLDAVVAYLQSEDAKVVTLVTETIQGLVINEVRKAVDNDQDFDQAKLDALFADGKLGLEAIANQPRSERNMLTNEELGEFGKVYHKLAQDLLEKTESQATMAVVVFNSRIKKIAGNPAALLKVKTDLANFIDKADESVIEEHLRSLTYLTTKIDEYLADDITEDSL